MTSINWYPGHIALSLKEIKFFLKQVDYIIEIRDARAPSACDTRIIKNLSANKKLVVLTKCDLADPCLNKEWCHSFKNFYDDCFCLNLKKNNRKILLNFLQEKQKIKNKILKVIILGVPNTGKSTLINNIINRKVAQVKNIPGSTKRFQWHQILPKIYLLDTPGILDFVKNSNHTDNVKQILGLIGSMKVEENNKEEIVLYLLRLLKEKYICCLEKFLDTGMEKIKNSTILDLIDFYRSKNNILSNDNDIIESRVCDGLLNSFNKGKIGRITLEQPDK